MAFTRRDGRSFFHGAIGVRKDGAIVHAINGSSKVPSRQAHCEYRLSTRLDVGSVVYVVRRRKDGTLANSKPCMNCEKAMRSVGVRRVYYSIGDSEYGVMDL